MVAVAALSYGPLELAANKAAYPTEKVAQFVVEKFQNLRSAAVAIFARPGIRSFSARHQ
jgi:hypothetical protein